MPVPDDIPFTITRKPIKHLYLRINSEGDVHVSAPKRMPEQEIFAFVTEKRDWIRQKQRQRREPPTHNPDILPLWGQQYPIKRQFGSHNQLYIENNTCHLNLRSQDTALETKVIIEYYRTQLLPLLRTEVARYVPIIGVRPSEIRTKNMKTKWGTCNTQAKRLWFNVQLARYPKTWVAYVVVHEMVHLLEPSHNKRFWRLVDDAMPDWQIYHNALKHA